MGSTSDLPVVLPAVIGVAMILVLVWLMVRSVVRLERERGGQLGFGRAALHAWLLFLVVNLWDVVILDWLLFVTIQPSAFILPGTEGHPAYDDYVFHLKESYAHPVPWVGGLVLGLVVSGIATLVTGAGRPRRGSDWPRFTCLWGPAERMPYLQDRFLADGYQAG